MNYGGDLEKVGRKIFPFYLAILFISPIPFGSNRPWAWAILAMFSGLLLLIYLWNYARQNLRPPEVTFDIKLTILILISWILFQIFQLIPIPVEVLNTFSAQTQLLKQSALSQSGTTAIPLSFDLSAGLHSIYKSTLYFSMFVLTILLVQSRDRLRLLVLTIVAIGVFQSVWGISNVFIEEKLLLVGEPKNILNVVKGTFVNRNHFGGFINFTIASAIALMLASGVKEKRHIHRDKLSHHWQSRVLDWRIYLFPYFCLMLAALILSESRGAIFSCLFMLLALFGSMLYMKISLREIYNKFDNVFLLIGLVVVFSIIQNFSERFAMIDDDWVLRMDHWQNSLMIFKDFKLFGIGAGSFQYVYPLYDSGFDKYRLLHAHNDFIELLVEQGIVGFVLLASVVLICIKNALQALRRFSNLQQGAYAVASILAISGFLMHATMDFNFQIPSNAIYFFVFLAIALLQGMDSVHSEKRDTVWDEEVFNRSVSTSSHS